MISQADQQVLSTLFGEEMVTKLSGALTTDQEVSLGLRINGKIYSPEEQKRVWDEKISQGKELALKEVAKNLEIPLEPGEKDALIIANKLKTTLSSIYEEKYKSQTPSDEIIALAKKAGDFEQKYNAISTTLKAIETEKEDWKNKYSTKEQEIMNEKYENEILSLLPDKLPIEKKDALLITKSYIKRETSENGETIYSIDGKQVLDPFGNPENIKQVIALVVDKKGWLKTPGMGGEDRGGKGGNHRGMTIEQARDAVVKQGIIATSPEGLKLISEYTKKQ